MANNLEDFEILQDEIICDNLGSLNKNLKNVNNLILHTNIRSLNKNLENLIVFIERLDKKPYVVVCTET